MLAQSLALRFEVHKRRQGGVEGAPRKRNRVGSGFNTVFWIFVSFDLRLLKKSYQVTLLHGCWFNMYFDFFVVVGSSNTDVFLLDTHIY